MKTNNTVLRRMKRRQGFLGVLFCLTIAVLLGRIWYLKYAYGDAYERRAVMQQILNKNSVEKDIAPNRGYILDRNKQPLAVSNRVYTIFLDVTVLDSIKPTLTSDPKKDTLADLNELLGIPLSELESYFAKDAEGKLLKPTNYQVLARQVPSTVANELVKLRCVHSDADTLRRYIDPNFAPQTIGFLRGDAAWGLENFYNAELLGEQGRIYRTYDQENNPVTEEIPSQDGYTLVTTLDAGIQRIAQKIVDNVINTYECEYAGMMVMDPHTGEVVAMAQWPSFSLADPSNPEFFTDARLTYEWEALSAEEQLNTFFGVWGNAHTSRSFEPGSIFKPVVVAAALEENIIDRNTDSFFCGGRMQVADRNIPCWNEHGHRGQDVVQVLANSCNVAMMQIVSRLGKDLFYKYRCDFGYGEKTDIDLPGEASVSSPLVMYPLSQLNPVELATSSFGQGFNNTAIQAVSAFSAIINGGNLMKPYLVSQIVDANGVVVKENTPTVVRKVISSEVSDYMRVAMQSVVSPDGTGRRAMIEGYNIGGKTGTAQQGIRELDQYTVSFMGYFPVENPQYIILAMIDRPTPDRPGYTSASAAPMMREAISEIISYKNIRPSDESGDLAAMLQGSGDRSVLNDYTGKQLVEVTRDLNNRGIDYQVVGRGAVVKYHIPAAGQPEPKDTPIFLYMDSENPFESELTFVPSVEGLSMEQAEAMIWDAHLTPITFRDETGGAGGSANDQPISYNVNTSTSGNASSEGGTTSAPKYNIYKQYPAAGAEIQRGTEVKLKATPAG